MKDYRNEPGELGVQVIYPPDAPSDYIANVRRVNRERVWFDALSQLRPDQPYTIRLHEETLALDERDPNARWGPMEAFRVFVEIGLVKTMRVRMTELPEMPTPYLFRSATQELRARVRWWLRRLLRRTP